MKPSNDNLRPLSPSTSSTTTQFPSPFGTPSSPRVVRTCYVEAAARQGGLRATVYLKLALPILPSQAPLDLLTLNSHSHLLDHSEFYRLPLVSTLASTNPEALTAARHLDIAVPALPADSAQATIGRAVGRSPGAFGAGWEQEVSAKLVQEDKSVRIAVTVEDDAASDSRSQPAEEMLRPPSRPVSPVTPTNRKDRRDSMGSLSVRRRESEVKKAEFILVLRIDTSFGGVRSPSFANTIFLPLPPCLRNTVAFTMPPSGFHSSSTPQQDLSISPKFRPFAHSPTIDPTGKRGDTFSGSFPSTTTLAFRWKEHDAQSSATPPPLDFKTSSLSLNWSISELGWGTVTVNGVCTLEKFVSIHDRGYLDIRIAAGENGGRELGQRSFEVLSVEDDDDYEEGEDSVITSWDVIRPRSLRDSLNTNSADHSDSDGPSTPIPRRRPPTANSNQPRPPSFTSLFDTPPPQPVKLDAELRDRLKKPSLMSQKAPFGADGSEEVGEMSFEMSEEEHGQAGIESGEDNGDHATILRLFLKLSDVIKPSKMPTPSFSFRITASFPSITLRTLSSALATSSVPPASSLSKAPFRLALPSFSVPSSESEDSVVTVSAGPGGSVELLTTLASDQAGSEAEMDSPLPAIAGKARWKTVRTNNSTASDKKRRAIEDIFEIEVSIKDGSSRPTSLLVLDHDSPVANQTPSRQRTTSNQSRSALSQLSIPYPSASLSSSISTLSIRITPVPLSDPTKPWRVFTHLTFAHPFTGRFELPLSKGREIELCGAWDVNGQDVAGDTSWELSSTGAIVERLGGTGLRELLFAIDSRPTDGKVAVGDVLPRFSVNVAELAVEVLAVQGFDLDTSSHTFQTCTPKSDGASSRFARFLLPPTTSTSLNVAFSPPKQAVARAQRLWIDKSSQFLTLSACFLFIVILLSLDKWPPSYTPRLAWPQGASVPSPTFPTALQHERGGISTPYSQLLPSSSTNLHPSHSSSASPSPQTTTLETPQQVVEQDDKDEGGDEQYAVGWAVERFIAFPSLVSRWTLLAISMFWKRIVG